MQRLGHKKKEDISAYEFMVVSRVVCGLTPFKLLLT